MRHGSLFSGIGGFDLAAEWMGWENVFHCEWNKFGQQVLKYYWPKAISYEDITKTDFTIHRGSIDILTGGFPCQPYSSAGKRLGKEDERHLWPEMLRAIREVQPSWVVGENVFGLVNWSDGLVFHEVQTDLEAEGYEVFPVVLPACAVNVPHRRDRVWFIAYSDSFRNNRMHRTENGNNARELTGNNKQSRNGWASKTERYGKSGPTANPNGNGLNQRNGQHEEQSGKGWFNALSNADTGDGDGDVADTEHEGLERQHWQRERCAEHRTNTGLLIRSENKQYNRGNWENFPTVSAICFGDDGISKRLDNITFPKWRTESIKAGGNAIVPQVVHQIFKAIEEYERVTTPNTN
jgi:DNA (cytosine-5)-methyltransferase 1